MPDYIPDYAVGVAEKDFQWAKKEFSAEVLSAFQTKTTAWNMATKESISGAKSKGFMKFWKASAGSHPVGKTITGQNISKDELVVKLEDEETISYVHQSTVDKFVSHYDYRSQVARETGAAIARLCDLHTLITAVEGARTAASGDFPGGNTLTTAVDGTTVATAFPVSLTGSRLLQNAIGEIVQKMKDKDVDVEMTELTCFLSPYLHRVLRQDNSLMSRDYVDGAMSNKIRGQLLMVEGVWIVEHTNMPNASYAAYTSPTIDGTVAYNLDCSLTAAIILGTGGVATLVAEGLTPSVDWIPQNRVWQIGAAMFKGHKPFRLEVCGEIAIDGD